MNPSTTMLGEPIFNWYFEEEARRLVRLPIDGSNSVRWQLTRRQQIALCAFLLTAIAVASSIVVVRTLVERELARIRTQVARTVEAETWAWSRGDYATAARLVDLSARADWVRWLRQYQEGRYRWARVHARQPEIAIRHIEYFEGNRILVEVQILRAEVPDPNPYREHRFYRRVEGEWLRTATDASLWGEVGQMQIDGVQIQFRERDAQTVETLAAAIPQMLELLSEQFGQDFNRERLSVRVQPENVGVGHARFVGRELVLLSPELNRTPLAHDPAQALSMPLADALTERAVAHAVLPPLPQWTTLFLATQTRLSLAINPLVDTDEYPHNVEPLRIYTADNGLPTLAHLHETRNVFHTWASGWSLVAAETLVAYLIETYGRGHFDDLLHGMATASSWEEICRDLFATSPAEIEAGWHAYLRRYYGIH